MGKPAKSSRLGPAVYLVGYTAPNREDRRHPGKTGRRYPAQAWASINIPFRGRAGVRTDGR